MIDVENVETTGERCRHLSWRTPLNSSLCTFIGMKHITFRYIITMYLRLTPFTKYLPQMSFHLYFFAIFCFALGLHPWLCWLLERSQILGCPRQLQTCARLIKAGWRRPGGVIFPPINAPGMGRFQLLNVGCLCYGLELRFGGSDCNNRLPNSNHNFNHNS